MEDAKVVQSMNKDDSFAIKNAALIHLLRDMFEAVLFPRSLYDNTLKREV